ncbi:MAG: alpha/beta hydrolase [Bacteroidia bacterium]|nr:alpha/beta hydrolase [Bacteroidia bacterium]
MPSLQHQLIKLSANNVARAVNKDIGQVQTLRRLLDVSAFPFSIPKGVKTEMIQIGEMPAEWYFPPNADITKVILFVHGGGYSIGSIQTHRALVARMAEMSNCVALSIEYRLSPEHPFPAALEDVVHAYEWLILHGYDPADIIMAGDSAGGGLIMSTLITLRKLESPQPGGAVLMCPWVDLSFSSQSAEVNQVHDPIVTVEQVKDWGILYAGKYAIDHPMISPLHADLSNLAPIMIQASDSEVLRDDAINLHHKIQQDGGESSLEIFEGLLHVWHLFWKYVPESQEAINKIGMFCMKTFARKENRYTENQIRKAS